MLRFAADRFVKARDDLKWLESMLSIVKDDTALKLAPLTWPNELDDRIKGLGAQAKELGLNSSAKGIERLSLAMNEGKSLAQLKPLFSYITQSFHDELEDIYLLHVASARQDLWEARQLFGSEVAKSFASASADIEEAGKCLALERYTACVFHLMRVMEVGLRALGKSLNDASIDPAKNPSWKDILRKCEGELAKASKDRCAEWRADDQFFSAATANLLAVKDAWRNPTMHVEINYTEETALDVFNVVKSFMRTLAKSLHD